MSTLRVVHRWVGLLLALPLIVMGLTGTVLTLGAAWPDWAASWDAPAAADPSAPLNAVLDAARTAAPPGTVVSRLVPSAGGRPVQVSFTPAGQPRGSRMQMAIDPATARPLGPPEPAGGVMNWIRRLHENLLVPEWGGRQIAGWFGVGLVVLTVFGIPLWWPRRAPGAVRAAFTVGRNLRGLRLHRALHGASGIWLSLLLLATGVTGITQGFPQATRTVLGLGAGGPGGPPGSPPGGPGGGAGGGQGRGGGRGGADPAPAPVPDLDGAVALAQAALPGTLPVAISLPGTAREPVRLFMALPGAEGAAATRIVTVDAAGPRVLSAQPARLSAAEMTVRWAHDLHEGVGLGPVWRVLTALTGVGLPLFSVTGVAMWLLRRRNRRRLDATRRAALASPGE